MQLGWRQAASNMQAQQRGQQRNAQQDHQRQPRQQPPLQLLQQLPLLQLEEQRLLRDQLLDHMVDLLAPQVPMIL